MMNQPPSAITTGLGPLTGPFPAGTQTAPLRGTGILNLPTLGTTPVLVVGPNNTANQGPSRGLVRRCKIVVVTAGANVAWTIVVTGGTAPTITALGAGAATEGSLIIGGGGAEEWLSIPDNMDLYVVASAASTIVNITVVEQ